LVWQPGAVTDDGARPCRVSGGLGHPGLAPCGKLSTVMWIIRGRRGFLCGVVATVMLLAGCGSGPSQVGSAVLVGDRAVSVSAVRDALQWQLDNVARVQQLRDADKLPLVSRRLVRRRVVHELVDVASDEVGVRADERDVAKLVDTAGGPSAVSEEAGVPPERVPRLAADQVLLRELGEYYLPRTSVSFVGGVITSEDSSATAEDKARDMAERIAAHPDRAKRLTRNADEPLRKTDFALRTAIRQAPELATSALFGTEPGTAVAIQPSRGSNGWLVALVTDRTVATSQASDSVSEVADEQLVMRLGLRMLQPVARDLDVRVNPRYGVWDPTEMDIAPNEQEVSGYQFRSRTVRS